MQVTFNPYVSTNRQVKQYQSQNLSFQAINTPLAKRAMNPVHQKKGLAGVVAGVAYAIKSVFNKPVTTGNDALDKEIDFYTKQNGNGSSSVMAHYLSANDIHVMNETLKDYPQVLSKIYLTKNHRGKNPLYDADLAKMQEIHQGLENQPEVLKKIHLQKNKKGKIKAHHCDLDEIREIHRVFANQPEVLKTIHLTKNKRGLYPINYMKHDAQREVLNLFTLDEKTQSKLLDSLEGK